MTPDQLEVTRTTFEQYVIERTSCSGDLLAWSLRRSKDSYVSQVTDMMWKVWLHQQEKLEMLQSSDFVRLPTSITDAKNMRAVAVKYLEQFDQ